MNMEVEIISKTCIPPSSPTPTHLKTYKISLLDQFVASFYHPTILFYHNSPETNTFANKTTSDFLKQSLSESLSRFYPLAGIVKDRFSIDCNDEGVWFTEAKANVSLSQYLSNPDLTLLNKFLPITSPDYRIPPGSPLALIQKTIFACGGFSIGIYVSHMICDPISLFSFLKDWAAVTAAAVAATTADSAIKDPFLDGQTIFPPYSPFPSDVSLRATVLAPFLKKGKFVMKRIVFNESAVANLKAEASSNNINNPTRVGVVTAILSKCLMSSFKKKTGSDKPLAINHLVNLRAKMRPPVSECSLGNFIRFAGTILAPNKEVGELATQVKAAIKKVDIDFLEKSRNPKDGFSIIFNAMKEMKDSFARSSVTGEGGGEAMEYVMFSSWCNFGVHDTDFGWGKPIWAACNVAYEDDLDLEDVNLMILMDTRIGKGVEAWVSLKEDDFNFFERDVLLLQYASIDPSPI